MYGVSKFDMLYVESGSRDICVLICRVCFFFFEVVIFRDFISMGFSLLIII